MAKNRKEIDERLLSPVNDPGWWPYKGLPGRIGNATNAVTDVPDPVNYVPPLGKRRVSGEE